MTTVDTPDGRPRSDAGRASRNIATVFSVYEAFGRGDVPFILDQLDDAVEWEQGGLDHGIPWLQPGRGRDHAAGFFSRLGDNAELTVFEPGEPMANDRQVAVPVSIEATVKATGKRIVEQNEVHLWTFGPDGKIVAFRHLVDTHQHWAALQP
jgi:ketosteroid isomerase-like protein